MNDTARGVNPHVKTILKPNQSRGDFFYIDGSAEIELRTAETTGSIVTSSATITINLVTIEAISVDTRSSAEVQRLRKRIEDSIIYNSKEHKFQRITFKLGPGRAYEEREVVLEDVAWRDFLPDERNKWLGGNVIGREGRSDDVFTKTTALKYLNMLADEGNPPPTSSIGGGLVNGYTYYDIDVGDLRSIQTYTPTNAYPDISPEGASVNLRGLALENPGSSKRTREKWVPTDQVIDTEGYTKIEASKDVPYRLFVIDEDGDPISNHNLEAVLHPYFLWVKTPVW